MKKTDEVESKVKNELTDIGKEISGVDDWENKRKVGTVLGWSTISRSIGKTTHFVKSSSGMLSGLAKMAFLKEEAPELPTESQDPHERFQVAMDFRKYTDEDLPFILKESQRRFFIYSGITIASLLYGLYMIIGGHTDGLPVILKYVWPFVLMPILISITVRMAFFNYQIREKALYPFTYWLNRHWEWLPRKTFSKKDQA